MSRRVGALEGLRNTRRSMGDGTLAGRSRIAAPHDPRRLRTASKGITNTPTPVGEAIVLSGTVTVPAAGGGIIDQMDTIVAQSGFDQVATPGDGLSLSATASWLACVEIRCVDGYRRGSLVELTLNGTAVPENWPPEGAWNRWVGELPFIGNRQDAFDVRVTNNDGAEHVMEVTIWLTMVERLRKVAQAASSLPSVHEVAFSGIDTDIASPSASGAIATTIPMSSAGAGTVEVGDLLILSIGADHYGGLSKNGYLQVPSGWTEIARAHTSITSTRTAGLFYRIATAGDADGTNSYDIYIASQTGSTDNSWATLWQITSVKDVDAVAGAPTVLGNASAPTSMTGSSPADGAGSLLAIICNDAYSVGDGADVTFDSAVTAFYTNRSELSASELSRSLGTVAPSTPTTVTYANSGGNIVLAAFLPVTGPEAV